MGSLRANFVCAVLLWVLLAPLAGCLPAPGDPPLSGTGMDMFSPRSIRLHPLTRLASEASPGGAARPAIEARVEFLDQFGDVTKGVGTLRFDLTEPTFLSPKGDPLDAWSAPLESPADNKARWDGITRTYLVKHPLPANLSARRMLLTATLELPNGTRLTSELPLK